MNTLKYFTVLRYLLVLCPFLAQAQTNYKPGYVVTTAGDTLHGFIDYREWVKAPTSVSFRATANGEDERVIDVSSATYFEITGMDAYQRYEGPVTMNPVDLDNHAYLNTAPNNSATVFLKMLVRGKYVNLLSYTDDLKTRYFIQENDGSQPQELYFNRSFAPGSDTRIMEQKGYVGQLKHLAMKHDVISPKIQNKIETAHYAAYDLEKLIISINGSNEEGKAIVGGPGKNSRMYAGLALNSAKMEVQNYAGLKNPDSNPASFMPKLALGYDIFLNKHTQKFYLRLELTASAANFQIKKNRTDSRANQYLHTYTVHQQTASFYPQLMYSIYNREQFKYYVGAGVNLNLSNYSQNTHQIDFYDEDGNVRGEPVVNLVELPLMGYWYSFGLRTGVVINKKYEVTAIYSPQVQISLLSPHKVVHSSLSVGVNYLFN